MRATRGTCHCTNSYTVGSCGFGIGTVMAVILLSPFVACFRLLGESCTRGGHSGVAPDERPERRNNA